MPRAPFWILAILAALPNLPTTVQAANTGDVEIRVVDSATGELIACRMHLKDQSGKVVKVPQTIYWNDHFVVPGKVRLSLKPGNYTFEMERGPEYKLRSGNFIIERNADDSKTVEMVRFVDMASEGWYSGDLHVHRPTEDLPLLMAAEDLYVAPVITWSNKTSQWAKQPLPEQPLVAVQDERFFHLLGGEDRRAGGPLLFFNLPKPLDLATATAEVPSGAQFLKDAKAAGDTVHVDAPLPFAWDLPMWIATGQVDSIGVIHHGLQRDGMQPIGNTGKPFDKFLYPNPDAMGRWSLDIYYHLLNCGLRIPPSAGSGTGLTPNPLGYDRVYVHCGKDFSYENWFAGLKAGRVVITNGPLIRPLVNGEPPGHVFTAEEGEKVELALSLNLSLREKVEYLELVRDGKVFQEIRLDQFAAANGKLPPITFDKSGWLLVRAVTNNRQTMRYAMSAPWYVEIGYKRRVDKASAQFFYDWLYERARQLQIEDPTERDAVLQFHRAARDFWQKKLDEAESS